MKKYENKKNLVFLFEKKKKETLGLLNNRRNKYIKQRSHHSIFELLQKQKEGWLLDHLPTRV